MTMTLYQLSDKQRQQFEKYRDLLIEWNQKFNLTAITDPAEIQRKHFDASLLFAEAIKSAGFEIQETRSEVLQTSSQEPISIADVGSGGGFPGIPLKIAYPEVKITLIEATSKKCLFLKEVIEQLNLSDIQVVNTRAEDLAKDPSFERRFDVVTAKAVASLDKLILWTLPLLNPKGALITLKGLKEVSDIEEFSKLKENNNLGIKLLKLEDKVFVIVKVQG